MNTSPDATIAASPGPDAPVLGVAPVAPGQLRHDGAHEDEHRQAVDDLLVEGGEHETHRLGEAADVARVLDDAEEHRGGAHREELVPGHQVRAVEAEATPAEQDDEHELERQRRRDRDHAEVTEVDAPPRGEDVERRR